MEQKICTKCHQTKNVSEYYKDHRKEGAYRSHCKTCVNKQNAKYLQNHIGRALEYRKEYYQDNKTHIDSLNKKNYELRAEEICKKAKQYYILNRESLIEKHKEYYYNNLETIKGNHAEYRTTNREKIRVGWRNTYIKYKEKIQQKNIEYNKIYYQTEAGKLSLQRHNHKRRSLGHDPINKFFAGSEFHHLHINNDKALGIYIPKQLHHSCYHDANTGRGMSEINKLAVFWLIVEASIQTSFLKQVFACEGTL